MLTGEPGIGKTRLAEEAAAMAEAQGLRAIWGRCLEEAGAPPYLPWSRALEAALQPVDGPGPGGWLGPDAAAALEIAPGLAHRLEPGLPPLPALEGDQARFRLFMAVAHLWRRLAERQPLLLILDNLHWADPSSLRLLGFLVAELSGRGVVVLGTCRDAELPRQHPLNDALAELSRAPRYQLLRLPRLDREQTSRLIADRGGGRLPAAVVESIQRRTEGLPLFVVEMLRFLQNGRGVPDHSGDRLEASQPLILAGVRGLIGQRLNRLSATCCRVLAIAACVGRVFDADLLAPLAGAEQALAAIDEALAQHVLEALAAGRCQFSHALVREVLYDELPLAQRLAWHGAIADLLERRGAMHSGAGLVQLAFHHAHALPQGDPRRALDCALRAAHHSAHIVAHDDAVRLLQVALQINASYFATERRQRCELLLELGAAQTCASDAPADAQTFCQALVLAHDLGSPILFAKAALGFENAGWRIGNSGADAAALLEQALQRAEALAVRTRIELLAALCRAYVFCDRQVPAEAARARALQLARELGEPGPLSRALAAILPARHWPDRLDVRLAAAREALELAEHAGHLEWIDALTGWFMGDLVEQGDLAGARTLVQQHCTVAEQMRQPFMQAMGLSGRTLLAAYEGRFADAERLAGEAYAFGRRFAPETALGVLSMQMFTLRRSQGRLGEVLPALRGALTRGAGSPSAFWQPGLALICVELGLFDEARAAYAPLAEQAFGTIPRDAMWLTNIAFLAETCVRLNDLPRAPLLAGLLEAYAGRNIVTGSNVACHGSADRLLGLLWATAGDRLRAERHLQAAIAADRCRGGRPWCAESQFECAALLLRGPGSDPDRAAPLLQAALATSRELGMAGLERRCRALSDAATPNGLSRRELEVLRLLALGRSNRAIGESLFISPHTVANHVREILAKTDCANRTEAAAWASRRGLLPGADQS